MVSLLPTRPLALAALALVQQGITPASASRFLQMLYVAAAMLALLLVVVIAIAVIAWRKNKDKDLRP